MTSEPQQDYQFIRFLGWCLLVVGASWLGLLIVAAVTADDIALSYQFERMLITGVVAIAFVTVGVPLIWVGRVRSYIPSVLRIDDATQAEESGD
jgi:hypothetical protein